ncbi:MAG: alpha/beta hydrolase [Neomegalonema sp.]|nr:alpha/beta hydrolase [Neomegalonema sp.]
MRHALAGALGLSAIFAAAGGMAEELEAPGPKGPLRGEYRAVAAGAPVVLIIPGSGPTDRDGNNPFGLRTDAYKMLAEALAGQGVASLRIDKRGMFRSAGAIGDANAVTVAAYADDVRRWVQLLRRVTGRPCVWVAGHSEGGLVALRAAATPDGMCGLILLTTPGRPLGVLLRRQLAANPFNVVLLPHAYWAISELEAKRRVPVEKLPAALRPLFAPAVQPYLIDLLAHDPAKLAAAFRGPILIVHAGLDAQVFAEDAAALSAAAPGAVRLDLPGATHVLKRPRRSGRAGALKTYTDPTEPLDPDLAPAIRAFIATRERPKK